MAMLLSFWRMHFGEIFIVFLLRIAFTLVQVSCNSSVRGRLGDDGNTDNKGVLELTLDDGLHWLKLCDLDVKPFYSKYFKIASVVCKQLGHGPPMKAEYINLSNFNRRYSLRYNDDWCNVDVSEVSSCSLNGSALINSYGCTAGAVYVSCLPSEAEEYDAALVVDPESGYRKGLMLLYINGQWGPICRYGGVNFENFVECEEPDYGPREGDGNLLVGNAAALTYSPPVLICYEYDTVIESCSTYHQLYHGSCDPDAYATVRCKERENLYEENFSDPGNSKPKGLSTWHTVLTGFAVCVLLFLLSLFCVKKRGQQRGHSSVEGISLSDVNGGCNTEAINPSQETQPSSFQSYPVSVMQEADSAPPYPSLPDDPELPTFEEALIMQGASFV